MGAYQGSWALKRPSSLQGRETKGLQWGVRYTVCRYSMCICDVPNACCITAAQENGLYFSFLVYTKNILHKEEKKRQRSHFILLLKYEISLTFSVIHGTLPPVSHTCTRNFILRSPSSQHSSIPCYCSTAFGSVFFNPILSYLILSYPILSYPILSCLILSYPILSYPILS